jgi:hypothetical protein
VIYQRLSVLFDYLLALVTRDLIVSFLKRLPFKGFFLC